MRSALVRAVAANDLPGSAEPLVQLAAIDVLNPGYLDHPRILGRLGQPLGIGGGEAQNYSSLVDLGHLHGVGEPQRAWNQLTSITMILAGLVFGTQLRPEDVVRHGISKIDRAQIDATASGGARIKELVTLELSEAGGEASLTARVEPAVLPNDDRLAGVSGVVNAVVCRAEPVGEVMVTGPGAGPQLAGRGVLSDLIAVARRASPPARG